MAIGARMLTSNPKLVAARKHLQGSAEAIFKGLRRCPYTKQVSGGFTEHIAWTVYEMIDGDSPRESSLSLGSLKAALGLVIDLYMKPFGTAQQSEGGIPEASRSNLVFDLVLLVLQEIECVCSDKGILFSFKKIPSFPLNNLVKHCCLVVDNDLADLRRRQASGDVLCHLLELDESLAMFKAFVDNHSITRVVKLLVTLPRHSDNLPTKSGGWDSLPSQYRLHDSIVAFLGKMFKRSGVHGFEQEVVAQAKECNAISQLKKWSSGPDAHYCFVLEATAAVKDLIHLAEKAVDEDQIEIQRQVFLAHMVYPESGPNVDYDFEAWAELVELTECLGELRACRNCYNSFPVDSGGRCSNCKWADYCSKHCQRKNWKRHHKKCF